LVIATCTAAITSIDLKSDHFADVTTLVMSTTFGGERFCEINKSGAWHEYLSTLPTNVELDIRCREGALPSGEASESTEKSRVYI
jgi:hypothetical protein